MFFFTAVVCFHLGRTEKIKWAERLGRDPEESWHGMLSLLRDAMRLGCVSQG